MAIVLLLSGLILALTSLLVHLTQAVNIQVIAFQGLYLISDRVWGIGRASIYVFVTAIASAIAIIYYRELSSQMNSRRFGGIFLFSICCLFFGVFVHYAKACCDSPVIFYFGFPLSWLRGVTSSWHLLPDSGINYLIQNFNDLNWQVIPWNFFANFVFWLNLGFMFFAVRKLKRDL
jgi:hypothetical protein